MKCTLPEVECIYHYLISHILYAPYNKSWLCPYIHSFYTPIYVIIIILSHISRRIKINMPKVSVIMPVYNSEPTLVDSLSSLVNQTLSDMELILVNDCSTDSSFNILTDCEAQFSDKVLLVNLNENHGAGVQEISVYHTLLEIISDLWTVMILQLLICLRKCILKPYLVIMTL